MNRGFISARMATAVAVGIVLTTGSLIAYNVLELDFLETAQNQKILSNTEIIDLVKPSTVYIETADGIGSGMIISTDGHILTNAHVVTGVSTAKVKLSGGQLYSAEVKGRDEIIDAAILKISGENFSPVKFGDSKVVTQGSEVYTLGYPFGLEGDVSFKEGTISRRISDGDTTFLETSAEIHPGNSGGPLVNRYGEVIGMNSAGFGEVVDGVTVGETIKLALPINLIKGLIPDLMNGREILVDKQKVELSPPGGASSGDSPPVSSTRQDELQKCLDAAEQYTEDAFDAVCPGFNEASTGDSLSCEEGVDIPQLIDVLQQEEKEAKEECHRVYSY